MTLKELIDKIDGLIAQAPFSKEEIAAFWEQENDEQWKPESLLALAAAYEYLHKVDNSKEAQAIRGAYERRLDELKEFYSQR